MVARGQARHIRGGRGLRLAAHFEIPPDPGGRTRTSRGARMGAIGRSQKYVIDDNRGRVTGFKSIYPEDRHVFQAAALGLDV
jgi:hypothetical protein